MHTSNTEQNTSIDDKIEEILKMAGVPTRTESYLDPISGERLSEPRIEYPLQAAREHIKDLIAEARMFKSKDAAEISERIRSLEAQLTDKDKQV